MRPPMIAVDPDSVVYRAISGYGEGTGTMHLLRGVHTINFAFAGWHDGPVSVTMVGPDAAPVVVHQGPIHYDGTFTVNAPQAGIYAFNIAATGSWSLWTGKQPEVVEVPVEVEGPPAVLTEDACNAFLDGLGDGN